MPRPRYKEPVDPGVSRPEGFSNWEILKQAEFIAETWEIAKTRGATQLAVADALHISPHVFKKRLQSHRLPDIAKEKIREGREKKSRLTEQMLRLFSRKKLKEGELETLDDELRAVVEEFRAELT